MPLFLLYAGGGPPVSNPYAVERKSLPLDRSSAMPHTDAQIPNSENSGPPSRLPLLFIGKNQLGCWVVRDGCGLLGGLFVSRAEAIRFAMFETGGCPQAIVMVTGLLELDMSGSRKLAANGSLGDRRSHGRRSPSHRSEIAAMAPAWRSATRIAFPAISPPFSGSSCRRPKKLTIDAPFFSPCVVRNSIFVAYIYS